MKNKSKDIPYCLGAYPADIKPKLNKQNVLHLHDFITERYNIFKLREKGIQPPWTTNEILRDYKFTNVRREHDRTTVWGIKNIALNSNISYEEKLLRLIVFRLYSKIETCQLIGLAIKNFDLIWSDATLPIDHVMYTNAFYTSGLKMGLEKHLKIKERTKEIYNFLPCLLYASIKDKPTDFLKALKQDSPDKIIKYLESIMGIGGFLSYQIFVDWTYVPEFPFSENEFVQAGPGAQRGLSRIFSDPKGMSHAQQLFWLRDNLERLFKKIDSKFSTQQLFDNLPEYDRKFNVMSLQNCMCELSKYIKAVEGTGRPKNKYKGAK